MRALYRNMTPPKAYVETLSLVIEVVYAALAWSQSYNKAFWVKELLLYLSVLAIDGCRQCKTFQICSLCEPYILR